MSKLLILLTASLFLSEIILRVNSTFGFILYVLLITGCLVALSRTEEDNKESKLILFFMILPVIRIIELFIVFDFFWRTFIVYYLLIFLASFYLFKFKINPGYTKERFSLLPLAMLVAINIGFLGRFLNLEKHLELLILLPLIVYAEEIFFRGLLQNSIKKNYGSTKAVVITSMLYGIFSISLGFLGTLFMFGISLIIGVFYNNSKNIFLGIIFNLIIHILIYGIV